MSGNGGGCSVALLVAALLAVALWVVIVSVAYYVTVAL